VVDIEVLVISDGVLPITASTLATNVEPAELSGWLGDNFLPPEVVDWPLNVVVVRSGDRTILVDAGLGLEFPDFPRAGNTVQRLEAAGVDLGSVTDVVLTHMHMDHVGGLVTKGLKERLRPDLQVHAATAEAEFLKHKKIGAHGTDIGISPSDMLDMTQLSVRTDRVLPNGVCLLPPLKTCDKGNACLSCGHFATDATHLDELKDQHAKTTALVEIRRQQYRQRTGRELTDDNVWVAQRLRELHSLQAILDRLTADQRTHQEAIAGAGTANRIPLQPVATRGAHDSALRKADPHTPA
nr:MBL fold metallo-hydrolase [Streptomyces sp. DSM 41633]